MLIEKCNEHGQKYKPRICIALHWAVVHLPKEPEPTQASQDGDKEKVSRSLTEPLGSTSPCLATMQYNLFAWF